MKILAFIVLLMINGAPSKPIVFQLVNMTYETKPECLAIATDDLAQEISSAFGKRHNVSVLSVKLYCAPKDWKEQPQESRGMIM